MQMDQNMKGTTRIIQNMDKEFILGVTEIFIEVSL